MTDSPAESLPPEVEALVVDAIEPGEAIAWIGRPRPLDIPHPMLLALFVSGLFTVAFMTLWIASALQARGGLVPALISLPFLALGVAMVALPRRLRRIGEGTAYVVTDRRAILLLPGILFGRRVVSHRRGEFRTLAVAEWPDGSGNLAMVSLDDASFLWLASLGILYDCGFERVAQVREVESLIRRTLLDKGDAPA